MLLGLGCDIMDVKRVADQLASDPAVAHSLFTPAELNFCGEKRYPARHLAARFAAKEALLKALPGPRLSSIPWHEMEVTCGASGRPTLTLSGSLRLLAAQLAVTSIHLSLSHTEHSAMAVVVLETTAGATNPASIP